MHLASWVTTFEGVVSPEFFGVDEIVSFVVFDDIDQFIGESVVDIVPFYAFIFVFDLHFIVDVSVQIGKLYKTFSAIVSGAIDKVVFDPHFFGKLEDGGQTSDIQLEMT